MVWTEKNLLTFAFTKILNSIKLRSVVSNLEVLDGMSDECTLQVFYVLCGKNVKHGTIKAVVKSHYQTPNVLSVSEPNTLCNHMKAVSV